MAFLIQRVLKIGIFWSLLMVLVFTFSKNVLAVGTCTCNSSGVVDSPDNCNKTTETANCLFAGGKTRVVTGCECKVTAAATGTCSCDHSQPPKIVNSCGANLNPNCVFNVRTGVAIGCSCEATPATPGTIIPAPVSAVTDPFAGCSPTSINTALGCIPVDIGQFMTWLLPFLFRIAGGISFLLMVYGFILITLSKGDPKKVQGAKETITSAITGLLLSIFGLFILRLIVTGILKLPGIN